MVNVPGDLPERPQKRQKVEKQEVEKEGAQLPPDFPGVEPTKLERADQGEDDDDSRLRIRKQKQPAKKVSRCYPSLYP